MKMENLIASYEHQFSVLTAEITVKIGNIDNAHGAEKKSIISATERQLDEAQELLEQMDLEVRELPNADRGKLMGRMKSYQNEFNRLETQVKNAKTSNVQKFREELFHLEGNGDLESDQRTRLLDNTERLENSSRKLEIGYKVATDTQKIGEDILNNLSRDRETLERSRQRLREGDASLGKSSRILTAMARRIVQNRAITFAVLFIIGIVMIVVVYLAVTKK